MLLLRSARPGSGFDIAALHRPQPRGTSGSGRLTAVSIALVDEAPGEEVLAEFECETLPALERAAGTVAYFVSEERPNDFPRLPVRSDRALVAAGLCASPAEVAAWKQAFAGKPWETLVLEPAARSLLQ